MKRLLSVGLFLALVPFAAAQDKSASKAEAKPEAENPYKRVKVGEYATYKITAKIAGMALEGTVTQKVTAKTDKEVTVKVTSMMNGMEAPAQEHKIDLTKPYDPVNATLPADAEAKIEKLKEGKEKVKAGGKEYETTWESYKIKAKAAGQDIESEAKAWQSKDLPLQLVKMEMTMEIAGMKIDIEMELTETGSKAD